MFSKIHAAMVLLRMTVYAAAGTTMLGTASARGTMRVPSSCAPIRTPSPALSNTPHGRCGAPACGVASRRYSAHPKDVDF